jgi:hypothetical protein
MVRRQPDAIANNHSIADDQIAGAVERIAHDLFLNG